MLLHPHPLFSLILSGPSYIRPNQSYLYSNKRRHERIKEEHNKIMNAIISYLVRVHHISRTLPIVKQLTQQMETYMQQRYMTSLSYRDIYRAREELKLIKSVEYKLKKGKYILRVTDKSGIFHLGQAADYAQKAEAYRQKTCAYIELENDPLWTVFDKVVHLLNDLGSKDHIRVWQLNKMMPKRDEVALAYLYFIPKPHKVIF
jgi:hypoxanthine-guanine phosphoribosyltransferase